MRKLFAIAAFLLASSAAQAQYTFEYGGRTIRIDPDRGTVSIPGVYDNSGRRTKRSRNDADSDRQRKQQAPEQAMEAPIAASAKRPRMRSISLVPRCHSRYRSRRRRGSSPVVALIASPVWPIAEKRRKPGRCRALGLYRDTKGRRQQPY